MFTGMENLYKTKENTNKDYLKAAQSIMTVLLCAAGFVTKKNNDFTA